MKEKSFDRREELLEAALEEFTTKSYEEASLNSIIRKAGISKGTFYYHFKDKQALYLQLMQMVVDAKIEFMERKLSSYTHNEDLNIFESLKLQARFSTEFAKEYPKFYLLGLMFYREKGNEIYTTVMDILDVTSEAYYDMILEKAMSRGDFREGISIKFAKRMLTYLLIRHDEIFGHVSGELDFNTVIESIDSLIDFIQYGLGKRERDIIA
jgi:AcrR family transcriptional regulator